MAIVTIHLKMLRNSEYMQFLKNILELLSREAVVSTNVLAQTSTLQNCLNEVEQSWMVYHPIDFTAELTDADERRDRAIIGIKQVVEGFTHHFDTTIASAAQVLAAHIAGFGTRISKNNFLYETNQLTRLTYAWTNHTYLSDAVAMLGLGAWLAELQTVNTIFSDQYDNRRDDAALSKRPSVTTLRILANKAYEDLCAQLEALDIIHQNTDPYAVTIRILNVLIGEYKTLLVRRAANASRKRKGGESDAGEV